MSSNRIVRAASFVALVASLLASGRALAQQASDPMADAIQCLKAAADREKSAERNFRTDFAQAQRTLAENPDKSLPYLVNMLKTENVTQHRINAAIVLANIAASVARPSPEMIEAWKLCVNDSSDAVAYWGMVAMMQAKVSDEDKNAAVAECLKLTRSRILRIATAEAVSSAGFKPAVPLLIKHMQQLLEPYREQIKSVMVRRVEGERFMERGIPGERMPGYEGAPGAIPAGPAARPPAAVPPGAVPPGGRTMTPPGARATPGMQPLSPAAARPMAPAAPRVPGAVAPREGPEGETGMGPVVRYEPIDPEKLTYDEIEALLPSLQALPVYEELHLVGIWCETLVIASPTDPGFGFRSAPPWALDKCVEAAVAWLQEREKGQAAK